jgi:threonine dehydrogenase-like Zn-dependent dehydrogenase
MEELVYVSPGKLEWRETPAPRIESGSAALVRPLAVATCDLDVDVIRGRVPYLEGPYPFGHEGVAEVVEIGDDVTTVQPGDVVVVPFQICCGDCKACRAGHTGNCTSVPRGSSYGLGALGGSWGGFLSDVVSVPYADAMLVRLPDGIDPVGVASASDNLPDAWRTVGPPLAEQPGADVLVVGGGAPSIGLYAVALARALGAGSVDYADRSPERAVLAESLGARIVERDGARRIGRYAITVDASSHPEGLAATLRSTAADGICTSVGIYYTETTPVPLLEMYTKGITFKTGRTHARPAIPEVLALVADGRLEPGRVTSRTAAWADAVDALADPPTKLVLTRP